MSPESFTRKSIVAGVGYETGQSAKKTNSAQNVRQQLKDLGVLQVIDKMLKNQSGTTNAMIHFNQKYKELYSGFISTKKMNNEAAQYAALASYAFGSATANGAILGLFEEVYWL